MKNEFTVDANTDGTFQVTDHEGNVVAPSLANQEAVDQWLKEHDGVAVSDEGTEEGEDDSSEEDEGSEEESEEESED